MVRTKSLDCWKYLEMKSFSFFLLCMRQLWVARDTTREISVPRVEERITSRFWLIEKRVKLWKRQGRMHAGVSCILDIEISPSNRQARWIHFSTRCGGVQGERSDAVLAALSFSMRWVSKTVESALPHDFHVSDWSGLETHIANSSSKILHYGFDWSNVKLCKDRM